jgi:hypothetical protein
MDVLVVQSRGFALDVLVLKGWGFTLGTVTLKCRCFARDTLVPKGLRFVLTAATTKDWNLSLSSRMSLAQKMIDLDLVMNLGLDIALGIVTFRFLTRARDDVTTMGMGV